MTRKQKLMRIVLVLALMPKMILAADPPMSVRPMIYSVEPTYIWPIPTEAIQRVSSGYGIRRSPMGGSNSTFHDGIDIACVVGTKVLAIADGEVIVCAYDDPLLGRYIILRLSNGDDVKYGHLSETWVPRGTKVKQGQILGLTGNTGYSTGPHLHFEIVKNPMNLYPWMKETK